MIFLTLTLTLALTFYVLYLFVPQMDLWLWRAKRVAKKKGLICCLTFDDGPSEWTPRVLGILKDAGIKATFFVTGEHAKKRPEIVKLIAQEGHEIGNHTMTHRKLTFCSMETVQREIEECSEAIRSITGTTPSLFRAPHGFKPPLMSIRNVIASAAKQSPPPRPSPSRGEGEGGGGPRNDFFGGLTLIPWTKGIWDTDMPPPDELLRRVCKKFNPLEILLLHDGIDNRPIAQNRDSMIAALPNIIDEYKKRGYRFSTISELSLPFVRGGKVG